MKKITALLFVACLSLTIFAALPVQPTFAQGDDYGLTNTVTQVPGLPRGTEPTSIAAGIINVILSVLGALTLVLILYAGFLWLTAAGNEERIKKSKELLVNSAIALIIILSAYAISSFIITRVKLAASGTTTTAPTCSSFGGSCEPLTTTCTSEPPGSCPSETKCCIL